MMRWHTAMILSLGLATSVCMAEEKPAAPAAEPAKPAAAAAAPTAPADPAKPQAAPAGDAKDKPVTAPETPYKTAKDNVSYGVGLSLGSTIMQQSAQSGIDLNVDILIQGLRDAMAGTPPKLTEAQFRTALQSIQAEAMAKQAERAKAEAEKAKVAGEKNKAEGEKFLADNGKKEGVKTTASGLQYQVLKEGTGATPKASDTVKVHYKGTLTDGTEFDSSHKRGEPAVFPVDGVITGWTEALQLMKVGSTYRLTIPSKLAYGERGQRPVIAPNAVLLFDVELLGIEPVEPIAPATLPAGHPKIEPKAEPKANSGNK